MTTCIDGNTRDVNNLYNAKKWILSSYILRLRLSTIHKVERAFEHDISVNVKSSEYFSRVEASNPLCWRDLNPPVHFEH